MNAAIDLAVYKEALLFLITAGIVAPLFFRLRISPVLGFLLAGVALGPSGLGRLVGRAPWLDALALTNVAAIDRVAAFGVVFLLFMMGLELSFERLTLMRRFVFGFAPPRSRFRRCCSARSPSGSDSPRPPPSFSEPRSRYPRPP